MADILTNLRELSVAFFLVSPQQSPHNLLPNNFHETCNNKIHNCNINLNSIAVNPARFSDTELLTIINGQKLAHKICELFKLEQITKILWVGNQTQSDSPVDLIVNDINLSLKEESFILENMGLYKLLNIISNTNSHKKGLHVFETFALDALNNWYMTTRDLIIKTGRRKYIYQGDGYISTAELVNDNLILNYNQATSKTIKNFSKSNYNDFKKNTTSKLREKVFAKWISEEISYSVDYNNSKSACANIAGVNILSKYNKYIGTSSERLLRMFRIHEYEYFYGKTTSATTDIYKVPSISQSMNKIYIKDISYKVPNSQLNIYTEVHNRINQKSFLFRNELRYSHGQLNGTPEAKLYFDSGSDLSMMYEKLT